MLSFFKKIFGDPNKRVVDKLAPIVLEINSLEPELKKLSADELKSKTSELKAELKNGKTLDDILPKAFALVREASRRTTKMRHFDVQLLGGIVLHQGKISEMKTGEGKTLVATLPLYLNALEGKGAHLITVNDYLARRDTVWMGQIYDYLGLSVGCIQHEQAFIYDATWRNQNEKIKNQNNETNEELDEERDEMGNFKVFHEYLRPVTRKEAYQADITYGTNNEYGFDYLKDNMVAELSEKVQRDLNYAIVDEVDSILIDEARTPLIISAPAEEAVSMYNQFASLIPKLKENEDYNIDEKMRAATLTDKGIAKLEKMLGLQNIYEEKGIEIVHHIEQALKAHTLFKRDKDYVVKNNEVIIVDEFTGRLMPGRRFSEGLHQALEAKENVAIQRESRTLATITFQNYFRIYKKLAGMTGTAATSAEEFEKVYKLDVVIIPTNKPLIREDLNDLVYKSELGKFSAVVQDVKKRNKLGQPVLIGTISIEKNERLGEMLEAEGIKCNVLNAKNHEKEGEIIAQAGRLGGVTVATNMAGRGVDIILGGVPQDKEEAEKIKQLGGLHVIGTERHEARRIDNQLRGRAGRQGDPGSSRFFVSMEDDLMRIFGSDRMKGMMETLRLPEDQPIEHGLISRSIEAAQSKVEGNNYDIRKHVLEYDDVMNKHREVIYKKRNNILMAWELEKKQKNKETKKQIDSELQNTNSKQLTTKQIILQYIEDEIEQIVTNHTGTEDVENWNCKEIYESVNTIFSVSNDVKIELETLAKKAGNEKNGAEARTIIIDYLFDLAEKAYNTKEKENGEEGMRQIERAVLLRTIDSLWMDHLDAMEYMREGIGLRGFGQRDPLVEYKKEAFGMFGALLSEIQNRVVYTIYKVGIVTQQVSPMQKAKQQMQTSGAEKGEDSKTLPEHAETIGRNDPCPCGSGKKYKKCCGRGK
ncbi:MAG: preprotein translocase subunit SecA [Patescibacteria group bacterium]|nr:preprotein translocase subunit SecA [Patescibacteria group bacterium]